MPNLKNVLLFSLGVGCLYALCTSSASGDLHIYHAGGGQMDFKGQDNKMFILHQAAGISLNGRFVEEKFTLAPEDPRAVAVLVVDGSFINKISATLRATTRLVFVDFGVDDKNGPMKKMQAHVVVVEELSGDKLIDAWIGVNEAPVRVGDAMVQMRAAAPVQLVIANAEWEYTIAPGTYRVAHDGTRRTRIDIAVAALTDPLASPVAPHGLLGQGFDGKHIDGKRDNYVADKTGLFATEAQAEGGIEGHADDYLLTNQTNPFSTGFVYSRFDATSAPPRNTQRLNQASAAATTRSMKGATAGTDERANAGRRLASETDDCIKELATTSAPTSAPTNAPTDAPTNAPTNAPTDAPSTAPTVYVDPSTLRRRSPSRRLSETISIMSDADFDELLGGQDDMLADEIDMLAD